MPMSWRDRVRSSGVRWEHCNDVDESMCSGARTRIASASQQQSQGIRTVAAMLIDCLVLLSDRLADGLRLRALAPELLVAMEFELM